MDDTLAKRSESLIIGRPKPPKCRWCGSEMLEGFCNCRNCHRSQHPILGRLQVFNAPSWLAVLVAAVAVIFSWQQNDLVRAQVDETRKERSRAEDALRAADSAVRRAEEAQNAIEGALAQAKQARDDANTAQDSSREVLAEIEQVKGLIDNEATEVRFFLVEQIVYELGQYDVRVQRECELAAAKFPLESVAVSLFRELKRVAPNSPESQKTSEEEFIEEYKSSVRKQCIASIDKAFEALDRVRPSIIYFLGQDINVDWLHEKYCTSESLVTNLFNRSEEWLEAPQSTHSLYCDDGIVKAAPTRISFRS